MQRFRLLSAVCSAVARSNNNIIITRKKVSFASTAVKNPFRVLGLPPDASFPTVQKKFLQLAMKHHPDTASPGNIGNDSESGNKSAETFVLIREAFEKIQKEHNSRQLRTSTDDNMDELFSEQDFLDWFHEISGVRLTPAQRREMVHLYWKQHQTLGGHHPHGQSWDLARRLISFQDVFLRNREKPGTRTTSDGKPSTRAENNINLRRKRPRR